MPIICSKIAGVAFTNADGQQRQDLLAWIEAGHDLVLEREIDNSFDPNAVRVMHPGYGQLGYLPREVAKVVVQKLDLQLPLSAVVSEVWPAKNVAGKEHLAGAEIKFETPETS